MFEIQYHQIINQKSVNAKVFPEKYKFIIWFIHKYIR